MRGGGIEEKVLEKRRGDVLVCALGSGGFSFFFFFSFLFSFLFTFFSLLFFSSVS